MMIPGEYILGKEAIVCNAGRIAKKVTVVNKGDRPVQIGSHFHFFEVNREMEFDRSLAMGMRLNIPSGTAVLLSSVLTDARVPLERATAASMVSAAAAAAAA